MAKPLQKIAARRRIPENGAKNLCIAVQRALRKRPPTLEIIAACVCSIDPKASVEQIVERIRWSTAYATMRPPKPTSKPASKAIQAARRRRERVREEASPRSTQADSLAGAPGFPKLADGERPLQGKRAGPGQPVWKRVSVEASVEANRRQRRKPEEW